MPTTRHKLHFNMKRPAGTWPACGIRGRWSVLNGIAAFLRHPARCKRCEAIVTTVREQTRRAEETARELADDSRRRYRWSSIGGPESSLLTFKQKRSAIKSPPVVYCHNKQGDCAALCFDSWDELKELVNTLRGEVNSFDRSVAP